MSAPKVTVNLSNGAIGARVASLDGVSALVMSGVATGLIGYALTTPKTIYSLPEAVALGITASSANAAAYRHIKEFYAGYNEMTGLEQAELHIMLLADTVTLTQQADKDVTNSAKKLLDFAQGRARLLTITRKPSGSYTPTLTAGIDQDSIDALPKAQILGNTLAAAQQPVRVLIEGRAFALANLSSLTDLSSHTENRAAIVLGSSANDGSASAAYVMGRKAGGAVQRNIARVKSGALLSITQAYIGDTKVEDFTATDTVNDKRYIIIRKHPNKDGYYFNDDPMACAATDDYSSLARGCIIDKVHRIAHATYVEELADDVLTIDGGKLDPGVIAYLQNRIDTEVTLNMEGEISSFRCFIDPDQNVTSTNKVKVTLRIRPRGYLKDIEVNLGFEL